MEAVAHGPTLDKGHESDPARRPVLKVEIGRENLAFSLEVYKFGLYLRDWRIDQGAVVGRLTGSTPNRPAATRVDHRPRRH